MKKMKRARFQNRLKLHRETVRSLTVPDLQNVVGGMETMETGSGCCWPPETEICLRRAE
jgi:hypothetical protein